MEKYRGLFLRLLLTVAILPLFFLSSCSSKDQSDELEKLRKECEIALQNGKIEEMDSVAAKLLTDAKQSNNRREESWAHYFLGTYRPTTDPMPIFQKSHLDSAEVLIPKNDYALLTRLNNTKGLWELRSLNFPVSLTHFERALEYAKSMNDPRMVLAIESNLTELYRLMNDTLGFGHSKEIYDKAIENHYADLKIASAFSCASYLAEHSSDSLQLNSYLKELSKSSTLRGWDQILRATFYARQGEFKKADGIMEGLDSVKWSSTYPILLMAEIKSALGDYHSSNNLIEDATQVYKVIKQDNRWVELIKLQATNQASTGNYREAFYEMERFSTLQDSLARAEATNIAKAWRIRYQVKQKEEKLKSAEDKAEKLMMILIAIGFIVCMSVVGFIIFYQYRRRHYLRVISQIKESITLEDELKKQQDSLRQQLSALKKEPDSGPMQESLPDAMTGQERAGGTISEKRIDEIFSMISKEMDENRIWADLNVTRESFADRINVNRTYFSQVIKIKTGLTYTQFMNARRIREAVRILSASEAVRLSDVAREVGFISESNFYTTFRKIMGMKPSEFIKLSKAEGG